jgi:N-acetylglutamate synthase-like GNAT family acetyltransferase
MNDVIIHDYSPIYQNSIVELILKIQNKEFGIPVTLEQQPDLSEISRFYQTGNGNFWIAEVGGEVAGTIALLDIGNHKAALRKMFVEKKYRGRSIGIGQKLLEQLIIWARAKKIDEIYLGTTEKFIAAQKFYEKNGFKEISSNELPPAFPVMAVDVKFYKFSLPDYL